MSQFETVQSLTIEKWKQPGTKGIGEGDRKDGLDSENTLSYHVKEGWDPKDNQDRDAPLVEPLKSVFMRVLTITLAANGYSHEVMEKLCVAKGVEVGARILVISVIKKRCGRLHVLQGFSQHHAYLFRHCSKTHAQITWDQVASRDGITRATDH